MDKASKDKIKEYKKQGKYNEIYLEFGQKAYLKSVPSKIKRAEIKQLKKEGRYEDIYNKYGEEEYSKILVKAMYQEIKEAKGLPQALLWKIGHGLKIVGANTLLATSTLAVSVSTMANIDLKTNGVKYEKEIEQYNEKINEYAKEVQNMKLTDVQIFMKVMDDMWTGMKGYKNPEKDIYGYYELDIATEEGYGVCRTFASDVAKKLNAIDPKYNARTMTVYFGDNDRYQIADIHRNIIEHNETVIEEDGGQNIGNDIIETVSKVTGNHMVTFVDVPEDNLIIVLDPTNPGIGIYKDGEIYMQNSRLENETEFEGKEIINSFWSGRERGATETAKSYFKSFKDSNLTDEEIEAKYGIEAQNRALEEVRTMNKSAQDNFKEEYKVDVEEIDRKLDEIEQNRNLQK